MGKKRGREYAVGKYRLRWLHDKSARRDEACAVWYEGKIRHRHRLGVYNEDEARSALDRFARRLNTLQAVDAKTIGELWAAYLADRKMDGKGMQIFEHNWKALAPRFALLSPQDIDAELCRSYARDRFERGKIVRRREGDKVVEVRKDISPSTVWTELVRLRTCLQWAAERELIAKAPYIWVPSPAEPRQRVLTEDEVWSLIDACKSPHARLFMLLLIATGGRHVAVLELTWDRVSFEGGSINLQKPTDRDPMSKRSFKGRAIVPMNNLIRAALSEASGGAQTDHVIEWDGRPIKSAKKVFQRAVTAAGLEGVTPHTFRHTAATWLTEDEVPIEKVARYLGHKDLATTQAYSKPKGSQLTGAAEVVELRMARAKKKA